MLAPSQSHVWPCQCWVAGCRILCDVASNASPSANRAVSRVPADSLDDIKMDAVTTNVNYIVTNMPHWVRVQGTACDNTLATFHKVRQTPGGSGREGQ